MLNDTITSDHLASKIDTLVFHALFSVYPISIVLFGSGRDVLLILTALSLVSHLSISLDHRLLFSPTLKLMLLTVVYVFVNALFISKTATSLYVATKVLFMAIIAFSSSRYIAANIERLHKSLLFIFLVQLIIFSFLFLQYGSVRYAIFLSEYKIASFSNWTPALVLPFALFTFLMRRHYAAYLASLILLAVIIVFSESRFAYGVGGGLALLSSMAVKRKELLFSAIELFLIISLVIVFSNIFVSNNVKHRFASLSNYLNESILSIIETNSGEKLHEVPNEREPTKPIEHPPAAIEPPNTTQTTISPSPGSIRDQMEAAAIWLWLDNVFFGAGFNWFAEFGPFHSDTRNVISHNIYIVTGLGELGIIGFILIMAYTLSALFASGAAYIKATRDKSPYRRFYFTIFIGTLIVVVHAYFRPQFDNPSYFIFIILAGWAGAQSRQEGAIFIIPADANRENSEGAGEKTKIDLT